MKLLKLSSTSFIMMASLLFYFPTVSFAVGEIGLSPPKIEVVLNPGQRIDKEVIIINNTDRDLIFDTEIQDFVAGDSPTSATKILTTVASSSSLRNYISLGKNDLHFIVPSGDRRSISFTIDVPDTIPSGGYYASLLFSAVDSATSTINVATRLGTLVFVRISGPVVTKGEVKEFGVRLDKKSVTPVFDILFENQGEVYLNPYGFISISNWQGKEVDFIEIKPSFVMPHSQRMFSLSATNSLVPGWYKATLQLNRGYENVIDTKIVSITIWSWWVIVLVVVLVLLSWWLIHKFLWRKN